MCCQKKLWHHNKKEEDLDESLHLQRLLCEKASLDQCLTPTKNISHMRAPSKEDGDEKEAGAFPIWDCGSPLYDSYELVSLAYTIERHMMVWPHLGGPKLSDPPEASSTASATKRSSLVASLNEFLVKGTWKKKSSHQRKKKKSTRKQNKLMRMCVTFHSWCNA